MPQAGNKANIKVMIVGHSMITHYIYVRITCTIHPHSQLRIKCGLNKLYFLDLVPEVTSLFIIATDNVGLS